MYQHRIQPFGKFEKHTLSNENDANSLSLVPAFGACVTGLHFKGIPILDTYQSPEEMSFNRWAKNVLLFPFPNRLREGHYQWEGRDYYFPINDTATGTALHGFGSDKAFEVASVEASTSEGHIRCRFSYDGRFEAYPFPFTLEVAFRLADPAALEVSFRVTNEHSGPIPFGLGWHPYFQLDDAVDEMSLQMPPCDMIGVDQAMIPTGKRYEYTTFTQLRRIGPEVLDNCFALRQQSDEVEVFLRGARANLRYWQEAGAGKFPFLQLFTPPHRQSLAVEPMSCNIDAFNNEEGLWKLEAGATAQAAFGLEMEVKK